MIVTAFSQTSTDHGTHSAAPSTCLCRVESQLLGHGPHKACLPAGDKHVTQQRPRQWCLHQPVLPGWEYQIRADDVCSKRAGTGWATVRIGCWGESCSHQLLARGTAHSTTTSVGAFRNDAEKGGMELRKGTSGCLAGRPPRCIAAWQGYRSSRSRGLRVKQAAAELCYTCTQGAPHLDTACASRCAARAAAWTLRAPPAPCGPCSRLQQGPGGGEQTYGSTARSSSRGEGRSGLSVGLPVQRARSSWPPLPLYITITKHTRWPSSSLDSATCRAGRSTPHHHPTCDLPLPPPPSPGTSEVPTVPCCGLSSLPAAVQLRFSSVQVAGHLPGCRLSW